MTSDIELRPYLNGVELRSETVEGKPSLVLSGTAISYGARSKDLGGFHERIMAGAVTEALQKGEVFAFEEHRSERYLGTTRNGSLKLIDSKESLRYEVTLPDTATGREVAHLAERGDYAGSSFGFRVLDETWTTDKNGTALRSVTAIKLLRDVGPTIAPAYGPSAAEVALRHLAAERELEVRSVLDAAAAGTLGQLLDGQPGDDSQQSDDAAADTTTDSGLTIHRRPTHWFV